MEIEFAPHDLPATPEYVLSVIRDEHRQQSQFDPQADPDAVLTFETTVAQWRDACDLVGWQALGSSLNAMWGIHISGRQWREVLTPAHRRTLWDVCALIAANATRPSITPAIIFGKPCLSAGAFLTVRSLLHRAGAKAEDIIPSAPLAPYMQQHLDIFLGPISRLSPGSLPLVRIRHPLYTGAVLGFGASLLLGLVGYFLNLAGWCMAAGCLLAGIFYVSIWVAARRLPASVEFGDLKTFRDLAKLLSAAAAP